MLIKCLTLCPLGTVNIVNFFEKTAVFTVFFLHRARRKPLREHLFKIPYATNQVNRAYVHACSRSLNGDLTPMEQHRFSDLVLVDYPFHHSFATITTLPPMESAFSNISAHRFGGLS